MMKTLAVLISNAGTGTNLQAIIDSIKSKKIKGKIGLVVSDSEDAFGIQRAKKNKVPTHILKKEEDILKLLKKHKIDIICLVGWKKIIPDNLIDAYPKTLLNIHPGLIPDTMEGKVKNPDGTDGLWNRGKFTGKAMRNVLDSKATYVGSTVAVLTKEFDFGPVLGRCFEKIKKGDTPESLYKRLKKKENQLYVEVLTKLCN